MYECVHKDGGYRCRSGVLKLKRCQALYTTTNLRHGSFSVSTLCGGDDDDDDEDDACLHFKSRPSADSRADLL